MAILLVAGEDLDWANGAVPQVYTSPGHYRSAYARCAVSNASGSAPLFSRTNPVAAFTSCWLHAQIIISNNAFGFWSFGLQSGSSGSGLMIGNDAAVGTHFVLYSTNAGTGTVLATESTASFVPLTLMQLDMQVISFGSSGTVNIYLNGSVTPTLTFTGDLRAGNGLSSLDSVVVGSPRANYYIEVSEVILATDDTRTYALQTLAPAGAGTMTAWTGAYTDVNEVTINDSTAVFTNTTGQNEQFTLASLTSGAFSIPALVESARASKTSGAIAVNVGLGVKSGSSIDNGSPIALTTAWQNIQRVMAGDPTDSNSWTAAKIAALQINFHSS